MFTNNLRMTGFSGIDVADMVQQMMRAESIRLDRLRQNRDILVWQQQMYRNVASSLNAFRTTHLTNPALGGVGAANSFRNPANFNVFNATVTGPGGAPATGATITPGTAAAAGSHTLTVTQTAQADTFRTGNFNINHSGAASSGINLAGLMNPTNFSANTFERGMSFRMNVNGIAREVEIGASELNTIFAGADFTNINNIRQQIYDHQQVRDNADPPLSGTDLETWQTQMNTLRTNLDNAFGVLTTDPARGAALANAMNTAVGTTFGNSGSPPVQRVNVSFTGGQFVFTASQGNTATLLNSQAAGSTGPVGLNTQQLGVSSLPSGGLVSTALNANSSLQDFLGLSGFNSTIFTLNGVIFDIDFMSNTITAGDRIIDRDTQDLRIQDLITAVNTSGTGATMSFSALTGQFTLQANQTGESSAITGTFASWWNGLLGGPGEAFAQTQVAQNAEFTLNGVSMSRETNTFTVEGLTVNLNQNLDTSSPVVFEINVSRDLGQVREFIMSFIEQYNKLVGSILDLTETRRPRTDGGRSFFMPLTQDQRRAMSESEIAQWEEQARTGLLHRDETLRRITGDLRSSIFTNVPTASGGTVNLVQLGIRSSDRLSDMGRLELRDPAMLDNMLENHLEDVIALFTRFPSGPADTVPGGAHFNLGIAERMENILRDQTSPNVRGNLFNLAGLENHPLGHNNTMTNRINEQERRIDNMLTWLERRENQLFAQFSRMEVAMMQANSQMMFFDQLFWAGQ